MPAGASMNGRAGTMSSRTGKCFSEYGWVPSMGPYSVEQSEQSCIWPWARMTYRVGFMGSMLVDGDCNENRPVRPGNTQEERV